MKMADNALMILKNNFEANNSNCVEAEGDEIAKTSSGDVEKTPIAQPEDSTINVSSEVCTQEEAANEHLAGNNKTDEFLDDTNNSQEHVSLKTEEPLEIRIETNNDNEKPDNDLLTNRSGVKAKFAAHKSTPKKNYIIKTLKKRSIKCLNKMQIMENVVEGGNVQPSSPGQADGRADEVQVKTETKSDGLDNEVSEEKEEEKIEEEISTEKSKIETVPNGVKEENDTNEVQDENYSDNSSPKVDNNNKRKSDNPDYPIKRLKTEIQENFLSRDKIINDFIDMADCTNLDQINSFSEQLLVEIKTLNEFAREKEREWNNIIHLKKLKEELLLRMQRKKQILIINEKSDYGDFMNESQNGTTDERIRNASPQSILKSNQQKSFANVNGGFHRQKLSHRSPTIDQNGQGKRLTLDVQSIIADYRQRHPESVPRRGRRIRCSQNDGINKMNNSIINFSSMALGSGAQVRQGDVSNDLGLLLNSINMGRQDTARLQNYDPSAGQDTVSFKDMLLQFAKLSQNERNELIQNAIKPPPPYPEVTVHPVPTSTPPPAQTNSSLLHGILTKTPSKQNSKTSFSPTLARLLTAPERSANNATMGASPISNSPLHSSNMSISEILSTSKACNEITITPVDNQYESTQIKAKNMEEDETEDSADRLVIDENNDVDAKKQTNSDNNSDGGDDIPLCQGCNQKPAQFVCAGCGNQWYCSRDCQVNAWDEHSEVCTG
ncbi:unnamed protein product [Phyllotreta striolata]|uniref:MYND-type domain-containing protein n=1 Tax=Phyllotreta striolata TaxID=444603 RepID=A0A9P0DMZ8_PHYSR|nr:unnamed protein product [Phyllotreta striolata]